MIHDIVHPTTGKTYKVGALKPSPPMRHLRLSDYLVKAELPPPPPSIHYPPLAWTGLKNILGNDSLGDCTAAAAGHTQDVWSGNAESGKPWVTEEQAIQFYSKTCGYVVGDPSTGNGGNLADVMTKWKAAGFFENGASKLLGWATVEASDVVQVKTALWLFENLYMGANLPDEWINPMPEASGFTWGVAGDPDPSNGHCTGAYGYNANGVTIDTWGMLGGVPYDALAKYWSASAGGELYVLFSEDIINRATNKAPNGFDATALTIDLAGFA